MFSITKFTFNSKNQTNWDQFIDPVLFAMRTERQRVTKYSPFEVMFGGRMPRSPTELTGNDVEAGNFKYAFDKSSFPFLQF